MSVIEKMTVKNWDHSEADSRVEDMVAYDPEFGKHLALFALRFISVKGLDEEFAEVMEEIHRKDLHLTLRDTDEAPSL